VRGKDKKNKDEIVNKKNLNRRNLMNINKIRLQRNLVDYNIKIMKHEGKLEIIFNTV
jgi:hypothetical protein